MNEKIKVSVPVSIRELLCKDAEDFRIWKPSGEANVNAFINLLVMNYYEEFAADEDALRDKIEKALSSIPEKYAKVAFDEVLRAITSREREGHAREKSVAISFKPTKLTEGVFLHIENVLLRNDTLSSFYRKLFVSYAQKTKNEREKIIHRQNYELLYRAISRGQQVCLSLENEKIYGGVSVYAIAPARDELFNYALVFSDGKNRTIRLSKIKTVSLLADAADIPEESRRLFDRQIVCGAQYPIYATDDKPIRVQLSEKGKELFNKIYLYRPIPTKIEGDVYTFECSANQVLYYFERFGAEALILSPKKLGIFMRNYYHFALKKYRTVYNKD
ncbi:MAG: hypothetical protein J6D16_04700 [Clostridia bacterium]|nr:hypothetical protein [Clostridia bacterium]